MFIHAHTTEKKEWKRLATLFWPTLAPSHKPCPDKPWRLPGRSYQERTHSSPPCPAHPQGADTGAGSRSRTAANSHSLPPSLPPRWLLGASRRTEWAGESWQSYYAEVWKTKTNDLFWTPRYIISLTRCPWFKVHWSYFGRACRLTKKVFHHIVHNILFSSSRHEIHNMHSDYFTSRCWRFFFTGAKVT